MSLVPYVVEQTSRGERSYDIFSRLLNDRIIILSEEVNSTTASLIVAQMLYLEAQDPDKEDVYKRQRLAYTGAVKDDILDTETLGCHLMELLAREYPGALTERYKIEIPAEIDGWEPVSYTHLDVYKRQD